jgi:hypothetical protein
MSNTLGRKPSFNADTARAILEARKQFSPYTPARAFIEEMVQSGLLTKPCCNSTMARLLSGKLFPGLRDADGHFYDYGSVPRTRGGRPFSSASRDPNGAPLPKFSKLRARIVEETMTQLRLELEVRLREGMAPHYTDAIRMRARLDAIEKRLLALENPPLLSSTSPA